MKAQKVLFVLRSLPCLAFLCVALPLFGQENGWHLVWSDEFKQPDGSPPNPARWTFDTGGNGWGNHELEHYTSSTNNVRIENGGLIIEARKDNFGKRNFTSGRIKTSGKFSCTFGRFEARIKIPHGQGVWPAFWLLGTNIAQAGWPACGEIDIMENIGKEPGTVHGTLHGPGYFGGKGIGGPVTLPGGAAVADDFHVFAVECEPDYVSWLMDGKKYFEVTPAKLPKGARWVFNGPKFVILNFAVGGDWPGNPDSTTIFPQRMIVDYVRVFEKMPGIQSQK